MSKGNFTINPLSEIQLSMSNIPINKVQVNNLPKGFTPTSDGFSRKKRRSKEFKKILQKMSQEGNSIELEKQLTEAAFS